MKWLQKVDHITYVVRPDTIRKWAWLYMEQFGGKLVLRVDDTNPGQPSSMMLWCFDFDTFGIALVAGIDRTEKSHVTVYADRHGDHSVQHVAFQVPDIGKFHEVMLRRIGIKFLGPVLQRNDAFGNIRQVFAKPHTTDGETSAEVGFTEFVERPRLPGADFPEISFSAGAGTDLYKQAQDDMTEAEREAMTDFSLMPPSWDPGQAAKKA